MINDVFLHTHIGPHGIPCIARMTYWQPAQMPTRTEPGSDELIEFELLDENERPDPSLYAVLTPEDRLQIEEDLLRLWHEIRKEFEEDIRIAAYENHVSWM